MWEIKEIHPDPFLPRDGNTGGRRGTTPNDAELSYVVSASTPFASFLGKGNDASMLSAFEEGGRGSRVALADFVARYFLRCQQRNETTTTTTTATTTATTTTTTTEPSGTVRAETLDEVLLNKRQRKKSSHRRYHPYVVERSDFVCRGDTLQTTVRVAVRPATTTTAAAAATATETISDETAIARVVAESVRSILCGILPVDDPGFREILLRHVACIVLQQRLRRHLSAIDAIAFVADGSILPRKSGASAAPMESPPAVPFRAPADSPMTKTVCIDMGSLSEYLSYSLRKGSNGDKSNAVLLSGLVVPKGVTLICGGGYHGT